MFFRQFLLVRSHRNGDFMKNNKNVFFTEIQFEFGSISNGFFLILVGLDILFSMRIVFYEDCTVDIACRMSQRNESKSKYLMKRLFLSRIKSTITAHSNYTLHHQCRFAVFFSFKNSQESVITQYVGFT